MEVPASAPQIRSRITVVCAECKRLKLKCDRRNPCGSCLKRDTVSRCIYSAAAAEKVDLHSLNNRLIQVETMLAQITAGQFQPSYPFVSSNSTTANAIPSPSGTQQSTSTTSLSSQPSRLSLNHASIAIPLDDLATTWLHDLNVHSPSLSSRALRSKPPSEVKLEPTPIQLSQLNINSKPNKTPVQLTLPPASAYYSPSNEGTAYSQFPRVTKELLALLPQSEHYSHPSQNALGPSPRHQPQSQSYPSSSSSHHTPTTCTLDRLLALAEQALTHTHPWMNWKVFGERARAFVSRKKDRENVNSIARSPEKERQRERERERALQIFGVSQSPHSPSHLTPGRPSNRGSTPFGAKDQDVNSRKQSIDVDTEPDSGAQKSVPFFAWLCIAIAVGMGESVKEKRHSLGPEREDMMDVDASYQAYSSPSFPSSSYGNPSRDTASKSNDTARMDPAYWYHLSVQAVNIWESERHLYQEDGNDDNMEDEVEEMEMDLFSALLLQLAFLVRTGLDDRDNTDAVQLDDESTEENSQTPLRTTTGKVVVPLMGKIVAIARQMRLHIDPEESGECLSEASVRRKDKERDGNGKFKEKDREREPVNGCKRRKKPFTLFQGEMRRRVWWCTMYYDLLVSDISALPPLLPLAGDSFSTKPPVFNVDDRLFVPSSMRIPPPEEGGPDGLSWSRHSMRGLQVKCEVVKVVRAIKARINSPRFGVGMSPGPGGYSIEQAALMEGEVRSWMGSLPSFWKVSSSKRYAEEEEDFDELMEDEQEPRREEVHEVEVAPRENEDPLLTTQRCELAIVAHRLVLRIYLPFLQQRKSISSNPPIPHQANLGSVNAAHGIIAACKVLSSQGGVPQLSLFDFYPFGRTVFDAAVICAHAAAKQPLSILVKPALEDVDMALAMLKRCVGDTRAQSLLSEEYILAPREAVRIIERLRRKIRSSGDEGLSGGFPVTTSSSPSSDGQSPTLKRKHDDNDNSDDDSDSARHPTLVTAPLSPENGPTSSCPPSSTTRVNPAYVYPTIHPSDGTQSYTNSPTTATSATSTSSASSFTHPIGDSATSVNNYSPQITGGESVHAPNSVEQYTTPPSMPPLPPPAIRTNPPKSPLHGTSSTEKHHKKPAAKKPVFGIRMRNPKDVASKPVSPPFTRAPQQQQPSPHPPFQPPVMSAAQEQHQQAYRSRSSSLSQTFAQGHTHAPLLVKQEAPLSMPDATGYPEVHQGHSSPVPSTMSHQRNSTGDMYTRRDSIQYSAAAPVSSTPQHQQPPQPSFSSSTYDPHAQAYHAQQSHPPRKVDGGYATSYTNGNAMAAPTANTAFNAPAVNGSTYNGPGGTFAPASTSSPAQGYYVPAYASASSSPSAESAGHTDTMVNGNSSGGGYPDPYGSMIYDAKPAVEAAAEYHHQQHQEVYHPHSGYHDNSGPTQPPTSSGSSLAQATQPMMASQPWPPSGANYHWNGDSTAWNSS
ncbi:hypothetical protein V5O48_002588 [Marasmius crinis-equi]|uniref:Zn(2)-C6 fungal-type domain-containing protein n=1 Tax=Marasmius crinis-equi TaxID=585013 RepID=A0ABR3FV92_9AGAR